MKGWWYLRPLAWENFKSVHLGRGMWRKLLQLLGLVFQNSSFSKWDIPNLPKLWHFTSFTFLYLSILQLTGPLKGRWYLRPLAWGNLKSAQVGEGMWRKLSQFLRWLLQNPYFSKKDIPNLPKFWHFTSFTFLYMSILQLRYWIVMQYYTCAWKL